MIEFKKLYNESNIETQHPAAFPDELPYRCIKMFSYVGAVVYDPYAGVGTTLRVGTVLKRRCFGSEISENYCMVYKKIIKERGL